MSEMFQKGSGVFVRPAKPDLAGIFGRIDFSISPTRLACGVLAV